MFTIRVFIEINLYFTVSNSGRLMLMDSESQPPPAKRIRNDDYVDTTSLIVSPTAVEEFNFPTVQSVCQHACVHAAIMFQSFCQPGRRGEGEGKTAIRNSVGGGYLLQGSAQGDLSGGFLGASHQPAKRQPSIAFLECLSL